MIVRTGSRQLVGTTDPHWFACVSAVRRAKVHMATTDNHVFMLTEIAVHGYVEAYYGMCQTRCRHGGRCMFAVRHNIDRFQTTSLSLSLSRCLSLSVSLCLSL
eukprot:COSAG04_NODE_4193_length_2242_cov_2.218852_1_plen_102_part_10